MSKKCIICDGEALYKIKDSADFYCRQCAEENFGDLTLLVALAEEAAQVKKYVEGAYVQDVPD